MRRSGPPWTRRDDREKRTAVAGCGPSSRVPTLRQGVGTRLATAGVGAERRGEPKSMSEQCDPKRGRTEIPSGSQGTVNRVSHATIREQRTCGCLPPCRLRPFRPASAWPHNAPRCRRCARIRRPSLPFRTTAQCVGSERKECGLLAPGGICTVSCATRITNLANHCAALGITW